MMTPTRKSTGARLRLRRLCATASVAFATAALVSPTALAGKYGPLDPWAVNEIAQARYQAGDRASVVTDHPTPGPVAARHANYGALDPWALNAFARTKHQGEAVVASAATTNEGFNWGDAAIGAGFASVLMLCAAAAVLVRPAHRRLAS